jgi:hypothetical protein
MPGDLRSRAPAFGRGSCSSGPMNPCLSTTSSVTSVLTPAEVMHYCSVGLYHPGGAYYLVRTRHAHPFAEVFGGRRVTLTAYVVRAAIGFRRGGRL